MATDNKKNIWIKILMIIAFVGISQVFGFDILKATKTAFVDILDGYVVPIAIGVLLCLCAVLIMSGVSIGKALIITLTAGACFALASKMGGWMKNWGDNFENEYGRNARATQIQTTFDVLARVSSYGFEIKVS